ncbi:hypothetical protein L596_009407 [Steinernema carpocapsae]|uniref:TOG domain-containing protein n=1 Tax=Steinernema carpocapsae TaxID=34508 RepID=A0A4U5PFJ7_STECR|nr:hypothetical protein L596_009407 [Steinernema carpocapsae]
MGKIQEYRDKAVAESPASEPAPAPAAQAPAKKAPPKAKEPESEEAEEAPVQAKPAAKPKAKKAAAPAEEAAPSAPPKEMLFSHIPNGKAMRLKDEAKLKLLKWNFDAPTPEHMEQLKNLLGDVCKPVTVQMMFNKDFKMHLKVLEQMAEFLKEEPQAVTSNGDLIMKWLTLRFFDTNPAVLLRTLDFSTALLNAIMDNQEAFSDPELSSFLPYLLLKSGEAKDAVRGPVKDIVQLLAELSSPAKVYPILLDALKTKNSRQKAECLGMLENFIEVAGTSVGANAPGSLKLIAACISDRDSGVRNGALNAIVAAYREMGDRVFQAIGKINDKDRAMLDERIKRCKATKPPSAAGGSAMTNRGKARIVSGNTRRSAVTRADSRPETRENSPEPETNVDDDEGTVNFTRHLRGVGAKMTNHSRKSTGVARDINQKFVLDSRLFELSDDEGAMDNSDCVIRDTTMMNLDRIEPTVRLRQPGTATRVERVNSAASITSIDTSEQIDRVVTNMASLTGNVASEALAQLIHLMEECPVSLVADRIDSIGKAIVTQFALIRSQRLDDRSAYSETQNLLRLLCNFTTTITKNDRIIAYMKPEVLHLFLKEVLQTLCERRITELEQGKWVVRSSNVVVMNLCEYADPTSFIVASVKLICTLLDNDHGDGRLMDFLHKSIYKQTERLMKRNCDDLDLDRIIETLHEFMERYPDDSAPAIKTSRKAVEVLVQRIVVCTRHRISAHITRFPENYGKIISYIKRCLRGIEKSSGFDMGALPGQVPSTGSVGSMNTSTLGPLGGAERHGSLSSDTNLNQLVAEMSDTLLDGGLENVFEYLQQHPHLFMEFEKMMLGSGYAKLATTVFNLFRHHMASGDGRPLRDMNFVQVVLEPWAIERIRESQRRRADIKALFQKNAAVNRSKSSSSLAPSTRAEQPMRPIAATPTAQKPKLKSSEMMQYKQRLEELRRRREESPGGPLNRTFTKD